MVDVMICVQSAQVLVDDGDRLEWVRSARTTAHADHPVVVEYPHLWRKLEINYPSPAPKPDLRADGVVVTVSGSMLNEGELVKEIRAAGGTPEPESKPAAKDVRAWAKGKGIDVPGRGPIPDDVIQQYTEAQDS